MLAKWIARLVPAVLAVTGLACADAATAEPRHAEPVVTAPGRPAARDTPAAATTETRVRNVPPAFRLPPRSRVTALSDIEAGASFTLAEPDPQAVLSFYRGELRQGAFTVVADRTEHGTTSLAFRGSEGWAGMIYASTYRVTVALRRA